MGGGVEVMWVLTENGQLINLDHFYCVDAGVSYVAARNERKFAVVLCSCDDEEHGREIIGHIANALVYGVNLYDIRNAKFSFYTCGVCKQQFEVPRRGGEVRYHLYDPVCPDCWEAMKDKEAGGAAQ